MKEVGDAKLVSLNDLSLYAGPRQILERISFEVRANEIITIIGPNGAGKSSLVKLIAGLTEPSSGHIQRKSGLIYGYVPQNLRVDQSIPIKVSRFLSLANVSKASLTKALTQVGANHLWSNQIHTLSGGELQRVLIARAIARQPQLLILDEPLQGVDVTGQTELYRLISDIRTELGCSIVMVSHDLHLVMAQTDHVICLNQHICCAGKPENVSQHPEYLKLFGQQSVQDIAVYTHHHDHHHDLKGDVTACSEDCQHD